MYKFLDPIKVELYSKLPKQDAKSALLEYLKEDFGIQVARNYSFERIVQTAEERLLAAKEQEVAKEFVEQETEFKRTTISPQDILKGDKSILDYVPKMKAHADEQRREKAMSTIIDLPDPKPATLLATQYHKSRMQELSINLDSTDGDLILEKTFRPSFELTMRTQDGEECANIGYWVIDEILKLGSMWKIGAPSSRYHQELMTLIYYIQKHGKVIVRESRNSSYILLK